MVEQLTPRELAALLQDRETAPLLLDVREPWEFSLCRIPGARLLPMRQIPAALIPPDPAWPEGEASDALDPARPLVVICHHGIRSQQVALYLTHNGFQRVMNLQGGVAAWAAEVDPAMPTY